MANCYNSLVLKLVVNINHAGPSQSEQIRVVKLSTCHQHHSILIFCTTPLYYPLGEGWGELELL